MLMLNEIVIVGQSKECTGYSGIMRINGIVRVGQGDKWTGYKGTEDKLTGYNETERINRLVIMGK